jgi:hypothetical protein
MTFRAKLNLKHKLLIFFTILFYVIIIDVTLTRQTFSEYKR